MQAQGSHNPLRLFEFNVARATGLEPATPPNKHGLKRTSIALNRASSDHSASILADLVRIVSSLSPEDKILLAALFSGNRQGGDPK
jgi:hypothetical protein